MPVFKEHAPGTFCYVELTTSDNQAAGDFYNQIFGWGRQDQDTGEYGIYTQFTSGDQISAAMYKMTPDQETQGVVPNWGSYIAVADVAASTEKAKALDGNVLMAPIDVYDYGKLAVIADPTGGVFCLWETVTKPGVGVRNEANALCWNELVTRDTARAAEFYAALLDWSPHTSDMAGREYTVFYSGGQAVAGMMAMPEDAAGAPVHWLVYFAADDCDTAAEKAASLGGKIIVPPMDLPNVGRFAMLADGQGAVFGVVKMLGAKP